MPMLFRLDKKLTAAVGTCCCQLMISHFQFCKARISSANSPDIVTGVHSSLQNNQPLSVDFPHMEIAEIDDLFSLQFLVGGRAVDTVRFVGSGEIIPHPDPIPLFPAGNCKDVRNMHMQIREGGAQIHGLVLHFFDAVQDKTVLAVQFNVIGINVIDAAKHLVVGIIIKGDDRVERLWYILPVVS